MIASEITKYTNELSELKSEIEDLENKLTHIEFNESILKNALDTVEDDSIKNGIHGLLDEYKATHLVEHKRGHLESLYEQRRRMTTEIKTLFHSCDISNAICSICLDKNVEIFLKQCGHTYCSRCISMNKTTKCPQCRTTYIYPDIKHLLFS